MPAIDAVPTVVHVVRDWGKPSERFVPDLIGACRRTRPVVVTAGRPDALPSVQAPVRRIPVRLQDAADRPWGRRALRGLLLGWSWQTGAALLHAHFGYWAAHAARVAVRLGRPWMLSLHGHDLLVEDPVSPERDALRTADLVAVPSRFLADAASRAGFPDERIRVLPAGVDLTRHRFVPRRARPDGSVVVTFAGRYVAKKGPLDATAALRHAAARLPGLHAVFVGFGPLEDEVRAALRGAPFPVSFRDGSAANAVASALAETDLLLMPSRTAPDGDAETLGLVALEAQACGVPVIATRHGGLPESVGPGAGLLVAEGDVAALADAVCTLAGQPDRWAEMGRAGRRFVEARYDLTTRASEVEAHYLRLAGWTQRTMSR